MEGLRPIFGPRSGWYRRGSAGPGSEVDLAAKRAASLPCFVFLMRYAGVRIPASVVLVDGAAEGLLVCEEAGTGWIATLYAEDMRTELLSLVDVLLTRDRDDCRLYQGYTRDRKGDRRFRQTWLCTPTLYRGRQILETMVERERTTDTWKPNIVGG
jgi:hypothetical protein